MKTIVITGASRGIGAAIAKEFASSEYYVAINYNKSYDLAKKLMEEIVSMGGNAGIYKADVSNSIELNDMFSRIIIEVGHIDILVNNAGISLKGLLIDENAEDTQKLISTNLTSAILASKLAIKDMLKHDGGRIINISSIWGNVGASMEATYSASKAGLIGLTKALAKEYAFNNINVNCICPGVVDTEMNKNLSNEELDDVISSIPAKRLCDASEIASLVKFLTEKNGDYITGQIITVDGGFTL